VEPALDLDSGLEQEVELLAVQQLVSHRAVEALDERVLIRRARLSMKTRRTPWDSRAPTTMAAK
jgi:hypothetical protein